jgi:hypothetical protein
MRTDLAVLFTVVVGPAAFADRVDVRFGGDLPHRR